MDGDIVELLLEQGRIIDCRVNGHGNDASWQFVLFSLFEGDEILLVSVGDENRK